MSEIWRSKRADYSRHSVVWKLSTWGAVNHEEGTGVTRPSPSWLVGRIALQRIDISSLRAAELSWHPAGYVHIVDM